MNHNDVPPPRPRKTARLKQLSKSNRLMRRFYSGKAPTPQSTPLTKIPNAYEEI